MSRSAKGTKGEQSKEQLIECAARLFLQNGYNATGINEIISAAELTKGSFYFYFTSKKDLALEVAEYYNQLKINDISKAAEGRTWEAFVDKMIGDLMEKAKHQKAFGCPFAVLGMETAFLEPDVSSKNYASIKSITGMFADVLKKSGMPEANADLCADHAVAVYEGHLLFYRMSRDIRELEKLLRTLKEIYKNGKTTKP